MRLSTSTPRSSRDTVARLASATSALVESALARQRSGYYMSPSEQAASLLRSFARNHAFIDGNKRVAWALSCVFLANNGFSVRVTADDAESFLIERVIAAHADVVEIAAWLEARMVHRP